MNAHLSLRGTMNEGSDTNVSCYDKIAVYTGIKLRADEDILVKEKERNNSF